MTHEEMQRMMQFILEQQAQFAAGMQKLEESQTRTRESQAMAEEKVVELENLVTRLASATVAGFKDVNAKIDALVDAQIRTEESIKKGSETLNAKIDALAEAQAHIEESFNSKFDKLVNAQMKTDEAVRNLAELVDRQLRERRNGE